MWKIMENVILDIEKANNWIGTEVVPTGGVVLNDYFSTTSSKVLVPFW